MKNKIILGVTLGVVGLGLLGASAYAKGFGGGFGNMTNEEIVSGFQAKFAETANILGVSVDEAKAAWSSGKTMKDLAATKGITEEQFRAKMKEARTTEMKTRMQALVSAGVITQAQADQRIQFMQNNQPKAGEKGGRGMHGGGGFGFGL